VIRTGCTAFIEQYLLGQVTWHLPNSFVCSADSSLRSPPLPKVTFKVSRPSVPYGESAVSHLHKVDKSLVFAGHAGLFVNEAAHVTTKVSTLLGI